MYPRRSRFSSLHDFEKITYYYDKAYYNYINLDLREMYTKGLTSRLKKSLEAKEKGLSQDKMGERGH